LGFVCLLGLVTWNLSRISSLKIGFWILFGIWLMEFDTHLQYPYPTDDKPDSTIIPDDQIKIIEMDGTAAVESFLSIPISACFPFVNIVTLHFSHQRGHID